MGGYLSWFVVALLAGDEGGDFLLFVLAQISGYRATDWTRDGITLLYTLEVSVGPGNRSTILARDLLALFTGYLNTVLLRNIIALLPWNILALLTGFIPAIFPADKKVITFNKLNQ